MSGEPVSAETAPTGDVWTVARIIDWTTDHLKKSGSETPRLDAEILLAHARGCRRIQLYVQYHEALSDEQRKVMRDLVKRRAQHEPVAYLVGHREFFGLDFQTNSAVLIPRPETETLVLELIRLAQERPAPQLLDVGTGSGCIAIAAAKNLPASVVTAIDISSAALAVARANSERLAVAERVEFLEGDLFAPLVGSGRQFDVIASNPPYIPEGEMESLSDDVRLHEPRHALAAGPKGLDVIERLVRDAGTYLRPGGWLLIEIDPPQSAATCELLTGAGYREVGVLRDAAREDRVVKGRRGE